MVNNVKYNKVEEIPLWISVHQIVLFVYKLSKQFPLQEQYGLTSQFRRCVVSIIANISEGFYRKSIKELLQFFTWQEVLWEKRNIIHCFRKI